MPCPRLSSLCAALIVFATLSGTAAAADNFTGPFAPEGTGPTYPAQANGSLTAVPSLGALRVANGAVQLDGRLDEAFWSRAETGWGLQEHEPRRGGPPSVPTTFKVVYDDDALYFGVACWENDMADVSSYLGRRDHIESSDLVSLYVDPFHDKTTGYNFRVNPEGVLYDAYLFDNGNRDDDWNAVWDAAVSRDANGWYVEVCIPFAAIRFNPTENMTWGLQMYRWLHGRGEDTGWVTWDRNLSGFVSRWGNLTGLRDIENPRQLEILPYVVTRHTDPAVDGDGDNWQNFQNFGADLKYGLTANLTLNATFQPDFGQVEADPAVLNLSPFETWYAEKRPFFIEGARFFQHPDFDLFYSRRIGTGDPNARIRGAAKLTGKLGSDLSLAVLAAATDVGVPGKVHNPAVSGTQKTIYGLVRVGKEFNGGNHRINLMATGVRRNQDSFADVDNGRLLRDGYSAGMDFELNFDDRMYRFRGSAVGTAIDPFTHATDPTLDPEIKYGTGGRLTFRKMSGEFRGGLTAIWEHDKLDPNDMGILFAPDEKVVSGDIRWQYDGNGETSTFNRANITFDAYQSWFYAGNAGFDPVGGQEVWRYGSGHDQSSGAHLNFWGQHRSFHQGWLMIGRANEGTDKYATRTYDDRRGPLKTRPGRWAISAGGDTDWRKPLSLNVNLWHDHGDEGMRTLNLSAHLRWNQNEQLHHSIGIGWNRSKNPEQWLDNFANDGSQAGVTGIAGVDHVFAQLDQVTWDVTLRSSLLLDRNRSLQLYLQPFLTYGDYSEPRWLATADSRDLRPYDVDASSYDFNFGAVNLNLVYRWEYRPGSTIYLVWSHSKNRYEQRGDMSDPVTWNNDFEAGYPFGVEPGNTFLAKFSYWFSI